VPGAGAPVTLAHRVQSQANEKKISSGLPHYSAIDKPSRRLWPRGLREAPSNPSRHGLAGQARGAIILPRPDILHSACQTGSEAKDKEEPASRTTGGPQAACTRRPDLPRRPPAPGKGSRNGKMLVKR
jgi:hypothetical protein